MQKKTAILFFMILLLSCSSSSSDPLLQATVPELQGHSHAYSLRFADLQAGQTTFVMEEAAGHRHELSISEEQRALLLMQFPVTVESTEADGHAHPVTIYVADD